eukprot:s1491_g11.t1
MRPSFNESKTMQSLVPLVCLPVSPWALFRRSHVSPTFVGRVFATRRWFPVLGTCATSGCSDGHACKVLKCLQAVLFAAGYFACLATRLKASSIGPTLRTQEVNQIKLPATMAMLAVALLTGTRACQVAKAPAPDVQ